MSIVVELFAGPTPTVELIVPSGYHGLIKAELHVEEHAACTPGQRSFRVAVPASGAVEVTGPPLLKRVCGPDFHARYADSPNVLGEPTYTEVGFRSLKYEQGCYYFVVGTQSEYDAMRRSEAAGDARGKTTGYRQEGRRQGTAQPRRGRPGMRRASRPFLRASSMLRRTPPRTPRRARAAFPDRRGRSRRARRAGRCTGGRALGKPRPRRPTRCPLVP